MRVPYLVALTLSAFAGFALLTALEHPKLGLSGISVQVGLALAVCLTPFGVRSPRRLKPPVLVAIAVASFVLVRFAVTSGSTEFMRAHLEPTLAQAALLAALALLALRTRSALDRVDGLVALAAALERSSLSDPDDWHRQLARELTRSRRYERPLGVVLFEVRPGAAGAAPSPDPASAMHAVLSQRFLLHRVAHLIATRLREADAICELRDGSRLALLCTEAGPDDIDAVVTRVREAVADTVGAELDHGAACFPTQALTSEALLQQAGAALDRGPATVLARYGTGASETQAGAGSARL